MDRIIVRQQTYFDSVFLMAISAELGRMEGLEAGQVMLATPANQELLQQQGFALPQDVSLGPTDLLVALRAGDDAALDAGEKRLGELLSARKKDNEGAASVQPVGLDGALRAEPEANVVVISVPGDYAAYEAQKALNAGLHVMLFSDNVSVEDEIRLKKQAVAQGLFLMGPDCGTALINGVMLAFSNKVAPGDIGIVGASGTGTQEILCLIDRNGGGVSQAIGTGGRDLSEKVGALTTLFAIDALAKDPQTRVIVVVSKPPAPAIAKKVLDRLAAVAKPVVVHFVGSDKAFQSGNLYHTTNLETSALVACALSKGKTPALEALSEVPQAKVREEAKKIGKGQRYLRGLFTGGTMAAEALAVLRRSLDSVRSNLDHGVHYDWKHVLSGHVVIDLGDDEFTRGRPHPMIDPSPRVERLMQEAEDRSIAVVLLDVVLGVGSHDDPAGAMIPAIVTAKRKASEAGQYLSVVASVTGTEGDRQGLHAQIAKLEQAGVVVLPSNIQAVRFATALVQELAHV